MDNVLPGRRSQHLLKQGVGQRGHSHLRISSAFTVCPSRPFRHPTALGSTQIFAPAYMNVYTNVILKTRRSDGKSYFNVRTVAPYNEVWDSNQWARMPNAPADC